MGRTRELLLTRIDSYLGLAEWWRREPSGGIAAVRPTGCFPWEQSLPSRLPDRAVPAAPADHDARAEHHRHQSARRPGRPADAPTAHPAGRCSAKPRPDPRQSSRFPNMPACRAFEWREADSNRRHLDFQSSALPAELSRRDHDPSASVGGEPLRRGALTGWTSGRLECRPA